jgi:hypothetical protein
MPRKTFTAGEVLAAADVNEYLMDQSVMTFADSGARGSAIGTAIAQEGMLTYLEDTDAFEYWDGSAWVETDSGGKVVQVVNVQTGAVATGNTTIPFDDTIPQQTEGTQFMSLTITPTSATNILIIEAVAYLAPAGNVNMQSALFQDSTSNAIASSMQYPSALTDSVQIDTIRHYMVAGTTSATTFYYRAGPSATATVTFNGRGGTRRLGGTLASSITITELKP